jgi:hypothetical protein
MSALNIGPINWRLPGPSYITKCLILDNLEYSSSMSHIFFDTRFSFYFADNDFSHAQRLFERIPKKDIVRILVCKDSPMHIMLRKQIDFISFKRILPNDIQLG